MRHRSDTRERYAKGRAMQPDLRPDPWKAAWREFAPILERRLAQGHREYGGRSFSDDISPLQLVGEIEQELLDVVGWALPLWARMRRIRDALERLGAAPVQHCEHEMTDMGDSGTRCVLCGDGADPVTLW